MRYESARELAAGLRELADFVEVNGPKIPGNIDIISGYNFVYDDWQPNGKTARDKMREIALTLGSAEKKFDGEYFELRKMFGPFTLIFNMNRKKICERKVVGVEHVEEKVIPAYDREIVEWVCEDSILAEG